MADDRLSAGDLFEEECFLQESGSGLIVPKKGKLWEERDGTLVGKVAIIRPCMSRGKRIRKLPPIYTPAMLEANAAVFSGWPMYVDHLMEQAVEELTEHLENAGQSDLLEYLQESARSVKELGGRLLKTSWDPTVVFEDDEENGYQPGAIVGEYIPQPRIREMLEADPGILNVSINCWPTGARPGTAPWNPALAGMAIEGFRKVPMGSVDFVFKGGAGGRPILAESEAMQERAVSLLEAAYSSDHRSDPRPSTEDTDDMATKKLSEMKPEELREHLQEHAPHLVPALAPEKEPEKTPAPSGELTEESVQTIVKDAIGEAVSTLKEEISPEKVSEQVDEKVQEREEQRVLQETAFTALEEAGRNGLPGDWVSELKKNYTLFPSGPAAGLLVESEKDDDGNEKAADAVVKERVKADVAHAVKLIRAGGGPVVEGLGASLPDAGGSGGEGEDGKPAPGPKNSRFRGYLAENGLLGDDPEKADEKLNEVLNGGSR